MPTLQINNINLTTQANIYFDGKCISHTISLPDGSQKSVGVILPSTLTFKTAAPEIMECVAGHCDYKIAGSDVWQSSQAGDQFSVPAHSSFEIKVDQAYHYICHFG